MPPLKLYQFPRSVWDVPNLSSYCVKLETYLKMAGIEYEVEDTLNPAKAPKKKLPFINDGGHVVADSGFIIGYLKANYGDPLDQHLSRHQNALRIAYERLVEDSLFWHLIYSRFFDEDFWSLYKKTMFSLFPQGVRWLVARVVKSRYRKRLKDLGILDHSKSEIYTLGKVNLESLSLLLGEKSYMLGEDPSSLDAVVYGVLVNIIKVPLDSPLKKHALQLGNLEPYCDRISQKYFSS